MLACAWSRALVGGCHAPQVVHPGGRDRPPLRGLQQQFHESVAVGRRAQSRPRAARPAAAAPSGQRGGGWLGSGSSITGTAILSGWQSSPAEGNALTQTLLGYQSAYPNVKVDYQPLGGDYAAGMAAKFASGDVPDVFYVDAGYAQQWIDQGYLAPLDDYIAKSSFDTSQFFDGYASIFKGADGKTYGLPKDGNTIAMAYNTALVPTPPKTMDELVTAGQVAEGQERPQGAAVPEPGARPRARLPVRPGRLAAVRRRQDRAIDTPASKAAVQWYMDLFKNGLGMSAADIGDDWCGTSLGKKHAAITFEGGWLDPAMTSTYPDVKYAWAAMPTGSSGSPVTISYTVSYSIGRRLEEQGPGLGPAVLPDRQGRMTKWTEGGVALPSRKDVPTPAGKDVLATAAPTPSPVPASCPATTTSRRRSRTRSPTRSRRRRSTPARSWRRPRRPSTRHSPSSRHGPDARVIQRATADRIGGGRRRASDRRRPRPHAGRAARRLSPATCSSPCRWSCSWS